MLVIKIIATTDLVTCTGIIHATTAYSEPTTAHSRTNLPIGQWKKNHDVWFPFTSHVAL